MIVILVAVRLNFAKNVDVLIPQNLFSKRYYFIVANFNYKPKKVVVTMPMALEIAITHSAISVTI